jgi:hypothetical protein
MWPAVVASCNVVAVCVCSKVEAVVLLSLVLAGLDFFTDFFTEKELLTLEMDFWRISGRTSRREKFINEVIIEKMDVKMQFLMAFGQNN